MNQKIIFTFLFIICTVSLIFGATTDVGNLPTMYEPILIGTQSRIIHLDRILSEFDNGWGTSSSRVFTILQLPSDGSDLTQVNVDGSRGSLISTNDIVSNEAMMMFVPNLSSTQEQRIIISFRVDDTQLQLQQNCVLIVEMYYQCNSLAPLGDGMLHIVAPPVPEVVVGWNGDAQKFSFEATTPYLTNQFTTLIEFGYFNPRTDNISEVPQCSNRPANNGVAFLEMWDSAPSATFPQALSGVYPTYQNTTMWSERANNCSSVQSNSLLAFSELLDCRTRQGVRAVSISSNQTSIVYSGEVHVGYVRPVNIYDELAGYTAFDHYFPFRFSFKRQVEAIIGLPSDHNLIVYVRKSLLDSDGNLILVLETHYPGLGLGNADVDAPLVVDQNDVPCDGSAPICVQMWSFSKLNWQDSDNHDYIFRWPLANDNTHTVFVNVTLNQKMQQVQEQSGLSIGSLNVRLYQDVDKMVSGDSDQLTAQDTLLPTDRVNVRYDLVVAEEDQMNFRLGLTELILCYSPVEGYDISLEPNGKQGCDDPFINEEDKVYLIRNGSVNRIGLASQFQTAFEANHNFSNPLGPSTAASFYAMPLSIRQERVYTLHGKLDISQRTLGQKRVVRHHVIVRPNAGQDEANPESGSQAAISQLRIDATSLSELINPLLKDSTDSLQNNDQSVIPIAMANNNNNNNNLKNQNSLLPTVLGSIGVFAGIALVAIGVAGGSFFVIVRRRRQSLQLQHDQLSTEMDVISDI